MGGFGKATTAIINPVKNATLGLKAMSATPIIAILNILVTILVKLAEKFKGNAAAMEKLNSLFGAFSGIATIVDKIVDALAKGVGWLADKLLELADNFGLITEEMKASQQIAQDELALQGKARDAAKQTAEDNAKIAELRAKANERTKSARPNVCGCCKRHPIWRRPLRNATPIWHARRTNCKKQRTPRVKAAKRI